MSKFIELGAQEQIKTIEIFGKTKQKFNAVHENNDDVTVQNTVQQEKENSNNGSD